MPAHAPQVAQWLLDAAAAKRLNVTSVHLVSSHTGEGAPRAPPPLFPPSFACAAGWPPLPRAPCAFAVARGQPSGPPALTLHPRSPAAAPGVEAATSKICRERKGRDVFVVGAANVGKSAFVRAMLKEMSRFEGVNFDAAAVAHSRWVGAWVARPAAGEGGHAERDAAPVEMRCRGPRWASFLSRPLSLAA